MTNRQQLRKLKRSMEKTASKMQENANKHIITFKAEDTKLTTGKLRREHTESNSLLIFSRDTMPLLVATELKRSMHLSLGSLKLMPNTNNRAPIDKKIAKLWCELFFKDHIDKLYSCLSPSDIGIQNNIMHFYLFCDDQWKPFIPQSEHSFEIIKMMKLEPASKYFESQNQAN